MSIVGYIWIAIEAVGLIDVFRHSSDDWTFADRNRPFWVVFMVSFGPLFVIPYLFLVRPRFPDKDTRKATEAFRKQ
jgi:tryptophan-rich sensory protein